MRRFACSILCIVCASLAQGQDPPTFEIPNVEQKAFSIGGYLESRPSVSLVDRRAPAYILRFYDRSLGNRLAQHSAQLLLDLKYEAQSSSAFLRTSTGVDSDYLGSTADTKVYEGFLSFRPLPSWTVDVGKKTLKWGKGYAWTPVAFIDRPKNPEDPELALEGFVVASADYIKSFSGALKTFSFSPVVVPVTDGINEGFAGPNSVSVAGKVYLLYNDTDIDLIVLGGSGSGLRYGLDFSKNLASNFEVHGEFAYINDVAKTTIDGTGQAVALKSDAKSMVLGLRYLTPSNVTWIAEYFHSGAGYSRAEMLEFYSQVEKAYRSFSLSGDSSTLLHVQRVAQGGFGRQNSMRDYFYLRVSQPDAFKTVYLTPAVMGTVNLIDRSFTATFEALYRPSSNLELRSQVSLLGGSRHTEYGGKQSDIRLEFRVRYFF